MAKIEPVKPKLTDYRIAFTVIVPGKMGAWTQCLQLPARTDSEAAKKFIEHASYMEKLAKKTTGEIWQGGMFERIDVPEQTTVLYLGNFV